MSEEGRSHLVRASVLLLFQASCDGCTNIDQLVFERGAGVFCDEQLPCGEGHFCEPDQQRCVPLRPIGNGCGDDSHCQSGTCADGVCCESACAGECMTCGDAAQPGLCVAAAEGQDPRNDCSGTTTCNGEGECHGHHFWSRGYGDAQDQSANDVAVDLDSNVFLAGAFEGSLGFTVADTLESAGGSDAFLVRLDADGKFVWGKNFGASEDDVASAVAIGPDGDVCTTGWFEGSFTVAGTMLSAPRRSALVACFGPDGTELRFAKAFSSEDEVLAHDLAVDADGSVWVVGEYSGDMAIPSGPTLTGSMDANGFVLALDPAGAHLASLALGESGFAQVARAVALAPNGVVVAVDGRGAVDFGDGPLAGSEQDSDIYLASLDRSLAVRWQRLIGGAGDATASSLAVGPSGEVWLAGTAEGALVPEVGVERTSVSGDDAFVAVYGERDGQYRTFERYRDGVGPFEQRATAIASDSDGTALLTGTFEVGIAFPSGEDGGEEQLTAAGAEDVFLFRLAVVDGKLATRWAKSFGDTLDERAIGLAVDPTSSRILLAGSFTYRLDLGGATFDAQGEEDAFVGKLGP